MDLSGLRVLVVEDEFLVALSLERDLQALGCEVVGPAASLAAAFDAATGERLDAALLDVNLGSDTVFPAADALALRKVPFLFCSAFTGCERLPRKFHDRPQVAKPFTGTVIAAALQALIAPRKLPCGEAAGGGIGGDRQRPMGHTIGQAQAVAQAMERTFERTFERTLERTMEHSLGQDTSRAV